MENTTQVQTLLPAYLVVGEDELKKETVFKRLHARLEKFGDLSFNSEVFSGADATGEAIVAAANTLPFASSVRLVEVHDVDKLKKADTELIIEYLKTPCDTTVLALEGTKVAKNTRLYKTVASLGKSSVIDCAPIARRDMNKAVRSMAVGHGVAFTEGAAAALIDLVGTNTVAIDGEIAKLALAHRGSDPVNENEVISLVSRTSEVKPWELVNAFSSRNSSRCIYLLNRMESVSAFALLAMCVTRIRELITVKALVARGETHNIARVLKMPDWRVKNHAVWARNYSNTELIDALHSARDAEQLMKTGSNADEVFQSWLLSSCPK